MSNKNISIAIIPLFILGLGVYVYLDIKEKNTSEALPVSNGGIQATGDYTIEQIPITQPVGMEQPNLDRPVVFGSNVTPEVKKIITTNITNLIAELKKDGTSTDKWIELGLQRKVAGDFEGAKEVWEYASALSPHNYVSFSNLGDLYAYHLKNYSKAEENLKVSIKNKPDYISGYRALYELYHLMYAEKSNLADDILLEGLLKNPKSTDLMILLAQYYKETGNKDNARTYYQKALTEARVQGNTSLAALIEQEIGNL